MNWYSETLWQPGSHCSVISSSEKGDVVNTSLHDCYKNNFVIIWLVCCGLLGWLVVLFYGVSILSGSVNAELIHFYKSFKEFSLVWLWFCLHIVKCQNSYISKYIFSIVKMFMSTQSSLLLDLFLFFFLTPRLCLCRFSGVRLSTLSSTYLFYGPYVLVPHLFILRREQSILHRILIKLSFLW